MGIPFFSAVYICKGIFHTSFSYYFGAPLHAIISPSTPPSRRKIIAAAGSVVDFECFVTSGGQMLFQRFVVQSRYAAASSSNPSSTSSSSSSSAASASPVIQTLFIGTRHGGTRLWGDVDARKYAVSKNEDGTRFTLHVKNVRVEDAGTFVCNDQNKLKLVVVDKPRCVAR